MQCWCLTCPLPAMDILLGNFNPQRERKSNVLTIQSNRFNYSNTKLETVGKTNITNKKKSALPMC